MRTLAYCCQSFATSARKSAGVIPLTCPPVATGNVLEHWDGPYDYIYIDLHGRPGEACWRGDAGIVAITAQQVRTLDLTDTVIFAVNCYLGDDDSPMLEALLDAGAAYVIGGPGENFGGVRDVIGAAALGRWFRVALSHVGPLRALALAKAALSWSSWIPYTSSEAVVDALEFRAFVRHSDNQEVAEDEDSRVV